MNGKTGDFATRGLRDGTTPVDPTAYGICPTCWVPLDHTDHSDCLPLPDDEESAEEIAERLAQHSGFEEHNRRVERENRFAAIWDDFSGAVDGAIEAAAEGLFEMGLTADEAGQALSEALDESMTTANWTDPWREAEADSRCICPPELLARGGFKGRCPVHGSGS